MIAAVEATKRGTGRGNAGEDGDDDFEAVWKALANRTRRRMLDLLVDGAMTTGELDEEFGELSRFAVMQHLKVLEHAELVVVTRRGRSRYNHLNPVPIQQVSDRWISRYHRPFAESLVDLKAALESESAPPTEPRRRPGDGRDEGASA